MQSSPSITARGEQHEHARAAAALSLIFISFTDIGSVKHTIRMKFEQKKIKAPSRDPQFRYAANTNKLTCTARARKMLVIVDVSHHN